MGNLIKRYSSVQPYLIILLLFILSRLWFRYLGVEFFPDIWHMQFVDPYLLETDLLRSLFYQHNQPPGFCLFLGILLKLFSSEYGAACQVIFIVLGVVLAFGIYYIMVNIGIHFFLALTITVLYLLSPATILYENLLFYTYPITVLLVLAAGALVEFYRTKKYRFLFGFFILLSIVVITRSLFHPVWFAVLFVLVLLIDRNRKKVFLAVIIPVVLISAVFFKNYYLYRINTTSTLLGISLYKISLAQFSKQRPEKIQQLMAEGRISSLPHRILKNNPEAIKNLYNPSRYNVPVLDNLYETSFDIYPQKHLPKNIRVPNYNYYGYVDYYKQLKKDCMEAIKVFPRLYGVNVYRAFKLYLMETHSFIVLKENREKIASWDAFYSGMLTLGLSRIDAYLPFAVLVCLVMAISVLGGALIVVRQFSGNGGSDKGLLIFMVVTVVYVSIVGNLFEYSENYRYRFLVNPFLIILSCRVLQAAGQKMFCAKKFQVG